MDMPLVAINPSGASARSGMDLNGVSETEGSVQKFENELNEQSKIGEEEVSEEQESRDSAVATLDLKPILEKPLDIQKPDEIDLLSLQKGDDLSRLAIFLASNSNLNPSIQPMKSEDAIEAEVAVSVSDAETLKSILGQQQGSDAVSLSQDVKIENSGLLGEQSKIAEIGESEETQEEKATLGSLESLFGGSETDSVKGLAKDLSFKTSVESDGVRPKTLKSMVDGLWIQQNVKGEVAQFVAEPIKLQAAESASNLQVVKSFIDDLRPMLEQMKASKTGGEMVMSLRPGDLGNVRVELQVDKSQVQVALYAEKSQAREILQSQWNELKSQLSVVGLKLQEMSVNSMSAQASERQRDQGGNQRQPEWNSPKEKNKQADFEESIKEDRRSAA